MVMSNKTQDSPNRMTVVRADGDVLVDPDIVQESGLIISEKLGLAMPRIQQAVAYEWRAGHHTPIKAGGDFIASQEPPPAERQDELLNDGLDKVYVSFFESTTQQQMDTKKRQAWWKNMWLIACLFTMLISFVIQPMAYPRVDAPAPVPVPPPSASQNIPFGG